MVIPFADYREMFNNQSESGGSRLPYGLLLYTLQIESFVLSLFTVKNFHTNDILARG